jgi:hypothetical protein
MLMFQTAKCARTFSLSLSRLLTHTCWILPLLLILCPSKPAMDRVQAQAPPPQATQAAINQAIERGVSYLRSNQNANGGWGKGTKQGGDGGWLPGYTALAGITLIECGVPTSDPGVQAAAKGVRSLYLDIDSTYEAALAILLLDRMGEKSDKARIQHLAGKLISGQSPTGGWGYKVPNKAKPDVDLLLSALRKLSPAQPNTGPNPRERPGSLGLCIKMSEDTAARPEPPPFDPVKARAAAVASLPPGMKRLPIFADLASLVAEDPKEKRNELVNPTTDNSNTHFATLGLWASRKYDVPTERSFGLLANRYRTSQGQNGSWTYDYVRKGADGSGAMTCAALLGTAIGFVLKGDPNARPEKDPQVINAFSFLSKTIGQPAGTTVGRPTPKAVGGYYFLWGMERIAVLYDVSQLDNKDWYLWGAEILVGHQETDGSWLDGGYPGESPIINTCFALLFLKRANLTPDLSRRLTIDASALTEKINTKAPPPTPSKPPEPTVVIETAPMPHAAYKPKSEPVTATVTASEPKSAPPEPKSNLPWIIGLVVLMLAGGGLIFFAVMKKKKQDDDEDEDEDEEEERPRKKKKKTAKEADGNGNGSKRSGKNKALSKRLKADED